MSTDIEYMSTEIRSAREAVTLFKILGIKDITTERQRKNGTTVYELPMRKAYSSISYPIRFATYSTGYVRNISEDLSSCYQINKTKQVPSDYGDYTNTERILIPKWEDRLIYLAKFIIKNYYRKTTNVISDSSLDHIRKELRKPTLPWCDSVHPDSTPIDDIKVIINGHRYNIC
tara:strand:- start:652 stop:1173 length:522 start_codon:yes stop_codon:yes gene_type:complete